MFHSICSHIFWSANLYLDLEIMLQSIDYGIGGPSFQDIAPNVLQDMIFNQKQIKIIVFELLESLLNDLNNSKDVCHMFKQSTGTVSAECVLKTVTILNSKKMFCQLLFLFPEKQKRLIIIALSKLLRNTEFSVIKEEFLNEFSANYTKNVVDRILNLERNTYQLFFCNIYTVIEMIEDASWKNVSFLAQIISNIFGNLISSSVIMKNHFQFLIKDLSFPSLLDKLLKLLMCTLQYMKNVQCQEDKVKEYLFQAILKCKFFNKFISSFESEEVPQNLVVVLKEFLTEISMCWSDHNNDVHRNCRYILNESFSAINLLQDYATKDLLISQWKSTKNDKKKLVSAISCLKNNYYGHEELLEWLLSSEIFLDTAQTNMVIDHLTAYIINFGSTQLVCRLIGILAERTESNQILYCFQQVVYKCLPYFTVPMCNILLSRRKKCFTPGESCLWFNRHEKDKFCLSLNEVFNKLTSDDIDIKTMNNLSQLFVISPFVVLQDIIHRMFHGTLNFSVLKGILIPLPALFEFYLDTEKKKSSLFLYIKKSFETSTDTKAAQNLSSIITVIIDIVPSNLKSEMYHAILELLIVSNLSFEKTGTLMEIGTTLDLLKILSKKPDLSSLNDDLSLCEILLNLISDQGKFTSSENIEILNKNISLIVSNMVKKIENTTDEIRECFFASMKSRLVECSWLSSFYFFSLFERFRYKYKHSLPDSLLGFTKNLDPALFISIDRCNEVMKVPPSTDVEKWQSLFEISYVSTAASSMIIDHMEAVDVDEEICYFVEAINPENINIGKATAISECLKYIVVQKEIDGLGSWFRDDLMCEVTHHPTCFSLLVMIQAFQFYYSELDASVIQGKQNEIQNYLKIFHTFLVQFKGITDVKVCSSVLLYFFEQLVFNALSLGESITSSLLLLLLDIIIALTNCMKKLSNDICHAKLILNECHEIIDQLSGDAKTLLKDKLVSVNIV